MARNYLAWFLDTAFVRTIASFAIAFVLGTLIGAERQWRQRTAGLRTNVLVAVGAAAFTDLGTRLLGAEGSTRIISYIVSGIGFLGAGVILKEGTQIRGLNTAATLWCSAAVGAFAGAALWAEAIALSFFVVYALSTLTESIAVVYNDMRWVIFVALAVKLFLPDPSPERAVRS